MAEAGIRLQKVLSQAGIASRRHAERLIRAGQVRVNGKVVRELGTRMDPARDTLEVEGHPVPTGPVQREVWALYKPKGVVTTLKDPEGRKTVREFFPRSAGRLFPVGRLDYDAEGLILLTNDGEFAQRVAHPTHAVLKVYLVKVKGLVAAAALQGFAAGPRIDGRRRAPVRARVLHTVNDKTWCEVELREGTHHHLKKLFASIGHPVLKIKRYRIGAVALEDLRPGAYRRLGRQDIAALTGEAPAGRPPHAQRNG